MGLLERGILNLKNGEIGAVAFDAMRSALA